MYIASLWGLWQSLFLSQFLEQVDVFAHDIQAGAPEGGGADIDAEAVGQRGGISQTGRGEQVVVTGLEGFGILLIAGVETEAEEQAEHIRVVVERKVRTVVVRLHGPHVGMELCLVQTIAVRLFL